MSQEYITKQGGTDYQDLLKKMTVKELEEWLKVVKKMKEKK